jgi:hypothetical protein
MIFRDSDPELPLDRATEPVQILGSAVSIAFRLVRPCGLRDNDCNVFGDFG